MAPARRCSVWPRPSRHRQPADSYDSVITSVCSFVRRRRRRRRRLVLRLRFCWTMLRLHVSVRLALLRRVTDAAAAAAAVNTDDVDNAHATRRECTAVGRSNSSVQQRHFVMFLYSTALVDQLALQLSDLRLQTDGNATTSSSLKDDSHDTKSLAAPFATESDKQCVSGLSNKELSSYSHESMSSKSECTRHATQLCTNELRRTTSMRALLQRSCRIPGPVPIAQH